MDQILPVLDTDKLQQAANEYAMKGALKTLEEYYSGYSSPYRKAIEDELKHKQVSGGLELPDIIGLLNSTLSNEIDKIANAAVAETFIPMVRDMLTRQKPELMFSDILRKFIEVTRPDDMDDCEVYVEEKPYPYEWLNVKISCKDLSYELTLHKEHLNNDEKKEREGKPQRYQVLSLPSEHRMSGGFFDKKTMKLTIEGASLEMPFTKDILHDNFVSFIASMVIAKTKITMDTEEFDEDMFPRECHCD